MSGKSSISIIHATTQASLAGQQAQKSALENKASTLIGFAGGMIALLIGAKGSVQTMPPLARACVYISISLFLVSILLATIVGWVRQYRSDPNPAALAEHYLDKSEEDVQLQLISNLVGVWKDNGKRLENIAILLRLALFAQTFAFMLLGIVLVWSLI